MVGWSSGTINFNSEGHLEESWKFYFPWNGGAFLVQENAMLFHIVTVQFSSERIRKIIYIRSACLFLSRKSKKKQHTSHKSQAPFLGWQPPFLLSHPLKPPQSARFFGSWNLRQIRSGKDISIHVVSPSRANFEQNEQDTIKATRKKWTTKGEAEWVKWCSFWDKVGFIFVGRNSWWILMDAYGYRDVVI